MTTRKKPNNTLFQPSLASSCHPAALFNCGGGQNPLMVMAAENVLSMGSLTNALWWSSTNNNSIDKCDVVESDTTYQMHMVISGSKPSDISVKLVNGGQLLQVRATRRLRNVSTGRILVKQLEQDFHLDERLIHLQRITSCSNDGILTITVPKKTQKELKAVRVIPIMRKDETKEKTAIEEKGGARTRSERNEDAAKDDDRDEKKLTDKDDGDDDDDASESLASSASSTSSLSTGAE